MSKKGNYLGGNTVVGKNSNFFREVEKDGLSLEDVKKNKQKKIADKSRKLISNYINNIKLLHTSEIPRDDHFEKLINIYLREILILMFCKTKIGIKKKYRELIYNQLNSLGIKIEAIENFIVKHVSNQVKEKLAEIEKTYI